jgi:hypothetical protein
MRRCVTERALTDVSIKLSAFIFILLEIFNPEEEGVAHSKRQKLQAQRHRVTPQKNVVFSNIAARISNQAIPTEHNIAVKGNKTWKGIRRT